MITHYVTCPGCGKRVPSKWGLIEEHLVVVWAREGQVLERCDWRKP